MGEADAAGVGDPTEFAWDDCATVDVDDDDDDDDTDDVCKCLGSSFCGDLDVVTGTSLLDFLLLDWHESGGDDNADDE